MRKGRVDLIKLVCDRAGVPEYLVAAKTVRLSTQASQTQRQGGDAASAAQASRTQHITLLSGFTLAWAMHSMSCTG